VTLKLPWLLSIHCTARWYVLPPNRRNMIVTEECKGCKNFAFPIPDFPCASYKQKPCSPPSCKHPPYVNYNSRACCYQSKTNNMKHVWTRLLNNQQQPSRHHRLFNIFTQTLVWRVKFSKTMLIRGNTATCDVIHWPTAHGTLANNKPNGTKLDKTIDYCYCYSIFKIKTSSC